MRAVGRALRGAARMAERVWCLAGRRRAPTERRDSWLEQRPLRRRRRSRWVKGERVGAAHRTRRATRRGGTRSRRLERAIAGGRAASAPEGGPCERTVRPRGARCGGPRGRCLGPFAWFLRGYWADLPEHGGLGTWGAYRPPRAMSVRGGRSARDSTTCHRREKARARGSKGAVDFVEARRRDGALDADMTKPCVSGNLIS